MNTEELVELYNDASKIIFADRKQSTKEFIEESQDEWKVTGQSYKQRRQLLNISLRKLSGLLGCSESKLRKWENGEPVQAAAMLQHSYDMALQLEAIKQGKQSFGKDIAIESTLSEQEVRAFYDILWYWICSDDNTYDLYKFIRLEMDRKEPCPLLGNEEKIAMFSKLLDVYLEEYESLEFYKEEFEKLKKEIKELKGKSKLKKAN